MTTRANRERERVGEEMATRVNTETVGEELTTG